MKHTYNIFWYIKNIGRRALSVVLCFATLVSLVRYLAPEVKAATATYESNGYRYKYNGNTYYYVNTSSRKSLYNAATNGTNTGKYYNATLTDNGNYITVSTSDWTSDDGWYFTVSNGTCYDSIFKYFIVVYRTNSSGLSNDNFTFNFRKNNSTENPQSNTITHYSANHVNKGSNIVNNGEWNYAVVAIPSAAASVRSWLIRFNKNCSVDFGAMIFTDSYNTAAVDDAMNNFGVSYTVKYDANGGSDAPSKQTKKHGESLTLSGDEPKRPGYSFNKWKATDGSKYSKGATYTANASTTMTAQWTARKYTITYDVNGGEALPDETFTIEDTFTLSAPTRDGYTFNNWLVTDKEGNWGTINSATYKTTTSLSGRYGDVTLKAQWTANTYTVKFNADGGSAVPDITYTSGQDVTLPASTRTGYKFEKWSLTGYTNNVSGNWGKAGNSNPAAGTYTDKYGSPEFKAVWTPITYKINYTRNGSQTGEQLDALNLKYDTDVTISDCGFTYAGHTFVEWNTEKNGSGTAYRPGQIVRNLTTQDGGEVILHAIWATNTYTITIDENGGTDCPDIVYAYDTTKNVTLPDADYTKRPGYTLDYWVITQYNGDVKDTWGQPGQYHFAPGYTTTSTGKTGSFTLQAVWKLDTYSITYNLNGGNNPPDAPTTFTINSDTVTLPTPTRAGYTFDGWYASEDFAEGTGPQPTISTGSSGNKTYYAKWIANKYTVSFDTGYDGGTAPDITTVTYDSSYGTLPELERDHYTFLGWYTDKTAGTKVTGETAVATAANHTLYARWETVKYKMLLQNEEGGPFAYFSSGEYINQPLFYWYDIEGWSDYYHEGAYRFRLISDNNEHMRYPDWRVVECENGNWKIGDKYDNYSVLPTGMYGDVTLRVNLHSRVLFYDNDSTKYSNEHGKDIGDFYWYSAQACWNYLNRTPTKNYDVYCEFGAMPEITRNGYILDHWCTSPSCKVTANESNKDTHYVKDSLVPNIEFIYLYPIWRSAALTVTLDANGGSVNPASLQVSQNKAYGTLPTPVRTGYTFLGWYTQPEGGEKVTAETTVTNTKAHTLYAHWEANTYTLKIDMMGGYVKNPEDYNFDDEGHLVLTGKYGETITVPEVFKGGYFTHPNSYWNDHGDYMQVYEKGYWDAENNRIYTFPDRNVELHVSFYAKVYTATLLHPDGRYYWAHRYAIQKETPDPETGNYADYPLALGNYTVTGYDNFGNVDAWIVTKADGNWYLGEVYDFGTLHPIYDHYGNPELSYVAKRTVTLNANGGAFADGSTDPMEKGFLVNYAYGELPVPTHPDPNYTFDGWYTAQTGGDRVTAETIVAADSVQTLYARWKGRDCTVVWRDWDGKLLRNEVVPYGTGVTWTGGSLTRPVDDKYQYDFSSCWNTKGEYSFTPNENVYNPTNPPNHYVVKGDVVLVALYYWHEINVFVEIKDGDKGISSVTGTGYYDKGNAGSISIPLSAELNEGYEFYQWYLDQYSHSPVGAEYKTYNFAYPYAYKDANGNFIIQTITASSKPIQYTITYNLGGGTVSGNPTSYNVESEAITLVNPTKAGYIFLGWTGSNGDTPQTEVTIPAGSIGDRSYTANWQEITNYDTIRCFNVNGYNTYIAGCRGYFGDQMDGIFGNPNCVTASFVEDNGFYQGGYVRLTLNGTLREGYSSTNINEKYYTPGQPWDPIIDITIDPYAVLEDTCVVIVYRTSKLADQFGASIYGGGKGSGIVELINDGNIHYAVFDISTLVEEYKTNIESFRFDLFDWNLTQAAKDEAAGGDGAAGNLYPASGTTFDIFSIGICEGDEADFFGTRGVTDAVLAENDYTVQFRAEIADTYDQDYITSVIETDTTSHKEIWEWHNCNDKSLGLTAIPLTIGADLSWEGDPVRGGYEFIGWSVADPENARYIGVDGDAGGYLLKAFPGKSAVDPTYEIWKNGSMPTYNFTVSANWNRLIGSLTLTRPAGLDPDQDFIFTVKGKNEHNSHINLTLVSHDFGADSNTITVDEIPVGTYTVTEWDSWSWRYSETKVTCTVGETVVTAENGQSAELEAEGSDKNLITYAVGVINKIFNWLSDDSYGSYNIITESSYTVTWLNYDGTVLETDTVAYGAVPTYDGETPERTETGYTYTFTGWSPEVSTVKGNATYTAQFSSAANTYTVTFDGNGGTPTSKSKEVTYGEQYGNGVTANRTGYTFAGWYTAGGSQVVADHIVSTASNHTLYAHWTPVSSTVTFNANGGSVSTTNKSVTYDSTYGTLPTPTREGYTFAGWYTATSGGSEITSSSPVSITSAQTLYARWTANTDTKYTVIHYQQNLAGDGYDLPVTETYEGTTDTEVTPVVKSYTGFKSPETQTVTIKADGSLVVNYYYERNSYTVTLNKGTGISSVSGAGTYKYGASVTINATASTGYTWSKWTGTHSTTTRQYTFTMPASNVTDTANATANTNTAYKVYHYKQNVAGNGWLDPEIENKTGTTGGTPTYTAKTYAGFTYDSTKTDAPAIAGNGSTIVKLYYTRNSYKLTVSAGTGTQNATGSGTFKYGASVSVSASLKTGYKNLTWSATVSNGKFTMPAADTELTATATPITYTVVFDANSDYGGWAYYSFNSITSTYNKTHRVEKNNNKFLNDREYGFSGWNTKKDGTGTAVSDGGTYKNLSSTNGATVTLYAQWKNTAVVHFVAPEDSGYKNNSSKTVWQQHPVSNVNGAFYTTFGGTGLTSFESKLSTIGYDNDNIIDITNYMNSGYFAFDIKFWDKSGDTYTAITDLTAVKNKLTEFINATNSSVDQIEFNSSNAVADKAELRISWEGVWDNYRYYISTGDHAGWISIYIPMTAFSKEVWSGYFLDLDKINFNRIYSHATTSFTVQLADPHFCYGMHAFVNDTNFRDPYRGP